MIIGMRKRRPKARLTITLDADLLDRVHALVDAGRARSVSAFVEHAVAGQFAAEADVDAWLAEMLAATGGSPTRAERAQARRVLTGSTG